MAPETKSKKRKAAVPNEEVEKVKKVKQAASEVLPKKRKSTEDAISTAPKKSKAAKENPTKDDFAPLKKSVLKKKKSLQDVKEPDPEKPKYAKDSEKVEKQVQVSKATKSSKPKASEATESLEEKSTEDAVDEESSEDSDEEDIDDQTEALLKGFESDEDEEIEGDDYVKGQEIPALSKKAKKKLAKAARNAATQDSKDTPGVIYLGRIPHGFYEHEMRQYFSQFGDITRIRLSRNRKTGQSKHFAFIEFKSADVADIVARTMDNYLLFKHILKCKVVPKEQVHEDLFKGANKRFKKVPWNKMEGRKLAQGATESQWERRNAKELEKRQKKVEKMKELGYEFNAPELKSAKDVPKQQRQPLLVTADQENSDEEPKAIEAAAPEVVESSPAAKKQKKRKAPDDKAQVSQVVDKTPTEEEPTVANGSEVSAKKSKKSKKVKAVA